MMKTLKQSVLMVFVAGVVVSTMILLMRSPRTRTAHATGATEMNQQIQRAEPNKPSVVQSAPLTTTPERKPACVTPPPEKRGTLAADIASQPFGNVVRVRADRVLAKINDQSILLKHLVPLRPNEQEHGMTLEEYDSRLHRAIEMELTFQAAAAWGVNLAPEQKKRVDNLGRRHKAALEEHAKQGVTWSSVTDAQVEFEKRCTSALLLQQNLVALQEKIAPSAEADQQAQYERARHGLLTRLKAGSQVSLSTVGL